MTRIGIATPGGVRVISLTLCASITTLRRKRPGSDYKMVCSCREVIGWQQRGGGVVARRGRNYLSPWCEKQVLPLFVPCFR